MGLSMLGWIQVTSGWDNDTVWRHESRKVSEGRGVSGYPPPGRTSVGGRKNGGAG